MTQYQMMRSFIKVAPKQKKLFFLNQKIIKSLFYETGINYLIDSSVAVNSNNEIIKVIDFAIEEFEVLAKT